MALHGSLSLLKRRSQPDVWVFRYYADDGSRRVYKRRIVGTLVDRPKRRDAERAVIQLRVAVNDGAAFAPMNVEQSAAHFEQAELPLKAYSTREGYKNYLNLHVVPTWGRYALATVRSVDVETWLRNLKRIDGKPASLGTKTKIRNLVSALFSHAIRYEWAATNLITSVRTSAKRLRTPDILAAGEFQALFLALSQRERVLVLLAGTTVLRRGELIALRWQDIDFEQKQANVIHSIRRNVEGDTKTEASQKPVPLLSLVVEELKSWRKTSLYRSGDDFLLPSVAMNRLQPLAPDMILRCHIRPAAKRLGIDKQFVFHTFRHTLATLLRQHGIDIKNGARIAAPRQPTNHDGDLPTGCNRGEEGCSGPRFRRVDSRRGSSAPFRTLGDCMKAEVTAINCSVSDVYGGDDGARTRDLCRDSRLETRNL
jgi:integrase